MSMLFGQLISALVGNARIIFKYAVFTTFMVAMTTFSVWFVGFMGDIYQIISTTAGDVSFNSIPSLLGCALGLLGIDTFISSAFSIFFSAMTFWLTAVGYILSYKLGMKAYDGYFKVLS